MSRIKSYRWQNKTQRRSYNIGNPSYLPNTPLRYFFQAFHTKVSHMNNPNQGGSNEAPKTPQQGDNKPSPQQNQGGGQQGDKKPDQQQK
jgi:hypothetical protein